MANSVEYAICVACGTQFDHPVPEAKDCRICDVRTVLIALRYRLPLTPKLRIQDNTCHQVVKNGQVFIS